MTNEAIEARRKYKREWAKKNRDKVRECENRHWEKKAAEIAMERKLQQEKV